MAGTQRSSSKHSYGRQSPTPLGVEMNEQQRNVSATDTYTALSQTAMSMVSHVYKPR